MAKPLPIKCPADELVVKFGGVEYTPHEGESVTLLRCGTLNMLTRFRELNGVAAELAAIKGDANENERSVEIVESAYRGLAELIAPYLIEWDWTDITGRPLPPLDGTAGPLGQLEVEELQWLTARIQGVEVSDRPNASRRSGTSSSATEPTPTSSASTTASNRGRRS